jgi:hypothetical protein
VPGGTGLEVEGRLGAGFVGGSGRELDFVLGDVKRWSGWE